MLQVGMDSCRTRAWLIIDRRYSIYPRMIVTGLPITWTTPSNASMTGEPQQCHPISSQRTVVSCKMLSARRNLFENLLPTFQPRKAKVKKLQLILRQEVNELAAGYHISLMTETETSLK